MKPEHPCILIEGRNNWLLEHAMWLATTILSHQLEAQPNGVKGVRMQFSRFERRNNGGVLTCREDSGQPILITQDYVLVDLPFTGNRMDFVYLPGDPRVPDPWGYSSLYFSRNTDP
jgi:hypothetical protein